MLKKCVTCNRNITKKCPGLECSRCNKVVHADPACCKLSNKQINTLRHSSGIEWSCEDCLQNMTRRSSFIIPDDDADEESDTGHTLHAKSTIDTQKLINDISREIKKTFKEAISNMESSLEFLSDQISTMEKSINNQDGKIKNLELKNQDLQNRNKNLELRVSVLEQGLRQTEQSALSTSVEIAGLPEISPQDLDTVLVTLTSKLDVDKNDIQSAHRISSGKDKPVTVLVELKTKSARNKWISSSKDKDISIGNVLPNVVKEKAANRVIVREALTKYSKTLLYNAKQQLRNSFQFIWCKDGKVCARKTSDSKIFYIRCLKDIEFVVKQKPVE